MPHQNSKVRVHLFHFKMYHYKFISSSMSKIGLSGIIIEEKKCLKKMKNLKKTLPIGSYIVPKHYVNSFLY